MGNIIDADYSQQYLLPPSVEDWVGPEHPARFIREFVDSLDLEELGICWAKGDGPRAAYAAGLLLKVWLYGYYERVRSCRKLEKACRDHMGFMWLTGMHVPDHNTLNSFFRANQKGIRALFRKTVQIAAHLELVGFVLQAVDGTKIAAEVATRSGWHKKRLLKTLARLDATLEAYERKLAGNAGVDDPGDALPAEVQERQALRDKIRGALDELEQAEQEHMHPADRDARVMKSKEHNRNIFAYNAQAVADEKSGIVVACEVTQDCNDEQQLNTMLDVVQEQAGEGAERTVADTGYATGQEFTKAEDKQRDVVVALPEKMRPNPDKPYATSNFVWDKERDVCICPHGKELSLYGTYFRADRGCHVRRYRCTAADCPYRAQCTRNKIGRTVNISEYHEVIERQRDKQSDLAVQADLAKRGYIIEPVFAFIKQHLGFRRFTLRGLRGVRTQWSLLCTTYNLHRLFKLWRTGVLNPSGSTPSPNHKAMDALGATCRRQGGLTTAWGA